MLMKLLETAKQELIRSNADSTWKESLSLKA